MITLKINGKERSVDVSPDTPLLWVLRENLQHRNTVLRRHIVKRQVYSDHSESVTIFLVRLIHCEIYMIRLK